MDITTLNTFGIGLTTIFCLIYAYFKYQHSYWSRKNVPTPLTTFPFGNIKKVILRTKTFTETMNEFYIKMKSEGHRYSGIYFFSRKAFLVIDPDLAKNVLTTDFQYFHDRGLYYDEENDPLSANLVALNGEKWKTLRYKLTPTFSSGKLKNMFELFNVCVSELTNLLKKEEVIEVKEVVARFTTDVIGTCAFGIDCNSLKNPEAEFRKIGKRMFQENSRDIARRMFLRSFPTLAKKLKLKVLDSHVSSFFMNAVVDTVGYRRENGVKRSDFLQLLMELMDEEMQEPITMNQAAAQAFVFFLGGFETSASTITFAIYELASNVEIQNKLREEVNEMLKKNGGKFSYNGITEMTYMDKVVQETLRKWPTIPMLLRKCTKNYQLPGTDITIEPGTNVVIPTYSFHHDPEYYSDPHVFDPERFGSEIVKKRNDYTYLPFGNGPRICIGLRFALVQVKVALATMLKDFNFTLNEKSRLPSLDNNPMILSFKGGVWVNVKKIDCDINK